LGELTGTRKSFESLHNLHMALWRSSLESLKKALKQQSSPPILAVSALQPRTEYWSNPKGPFSVSVTLEMDYKKGMDRLKRPQQLRDALEMLRLTERATIVEWSRLNTALSKGSSTKIDPGKKIREQRQTIPLRFKTQTVNPPQWLLENLFPEETSLVVLRPTYRLGVVARGSKAAPEQQVLISLVSTQKGLQYRELSTVIEPLVPAFSVKYGRSFVITESNPGRIKKKYKFSVSAEDLCKSVRAELRLVSKGKPARRAWSVQERQEGPK
jgi:hypothetical protein